MTLNLAAIRISISKVQARSKDQDVLDLAEVTLALLDYCEPIILGHIAAVAVSKDIADDNKSYAPRRKSK